jgi:hypothetical protein
MTSKYIKNFKTNFNLNRIFVRLNLMTQLKLNENGENQIRKKNQKTKVKNKNIERTQQYECSSLIREPVNDLFLLALTSLY